MKSKLFGFSAKMALAAVAVCGMLTSCYEKEEIDKNGSTQLPDPVYVIYGTITDAQTGEAIPNASYSIDHGTVRNADGNGYFSVDSRKDGLTSDYAHTVEVDMEGYLKATRTVYMPKVNNGETCAVAADIALYAKNQGTENPNDEVKYLDPTQEQAKAMMDAAKAEITEHLGMIKDLDAENIAISVDNASGKWCTVVKAFVGVTAAVGEGVTVTVPSFVGFTSTVTPETTFANNAMTGAEWLDKAGKALNRAHGLTVDKYEVPFQGMVGEAINGYWLTITMENSILSINDCEGCVTYQIFEVVAPSYESHDSHDSHNAHGGNPGAGGGDGNSQGY